MSVITFERMVFGVAAAALLVAACTVKEVECERDRDCKGDRECNDGDCEDPSSGSGNTGTGNTGTGNTGTGNSTSTGGTGGSGTGATGPAPLTFFEEELVDKWYRFHSPQDRRDYWIFSADRTGCKWEQDSGSSTRKDKCTLTYWELRETGTENVFGLNYDGDCVGSLFESPHEYHYIPDEFRQGGYANLAFSRSTTTKVCE